jgi:hypothetical protein
LEYYLGTLADAPEFVCFSEVASTTGIHACIVE